MKAYKKGSLVPDRMCSLSSSNSTADKDKHIADVLRRAVISSAVEVEERTLEYPYSSSL